MVAQQQNQNIFTTNKNMISFAFIFFFIYLSTNAHAAAATENCTWEDLNTTGVLPISPSCVIRSAALLYKEDNLIIYGGGWCNSQETYLLNLKSKVWTLLNTTNKPSGRSRATAVLPYDDIMIMYGGSGGGGCDLEIELNIT